VKTDRTIPNNKPDIIMQDDNKKNMYANGCSNPGRQKYDKERSHEDSKI
jgi:hypothetical protein